MPEITLPQGTIHYRDTGEGPPVVFLHGLLVDGEVWRKVPPLLQGAARSIVPDLPLGSHRIARECGRRPQPGRRRAAGGRPPRRAGPRRRHPRRQRHRRRHQPARRAGPRRAGRPARADQLRLLRRLPAQGVRPDGQGGAGAGRPVRRHAADARGQGAADADGLRLARPRDPGRGHRRLDPPVPRRRRHPPRRRRLHARDRQGDDDRRRRAPAVGEDPLARRVGPGRSLLLARAGRAPGGGPRRPPRAGRGRAHVRERGRARGPRRASSATSCARARRSRRPKQAAASSARAHRASSC